MKILHVITSLRTGGAEHLMVDLLPRLRDMGNEVELLLFDGIHTPFYDQLEATRIPIHFLSVNGNVYNPLHIFRLRRYIKRFDVVHTHNTACQLFVPIAKTLTSSQTKIVTTEHSANNRRRGNKLFYLMDKWMYKKYDSIICISEQPRKNLEEYIGKLNSITTIYNGIDSTNFLNPIKDIATNKQFVISMVASFNAAKDQDTIVRALTELPDCYSVQFAGDGVRRKEVEDLVSELGMNDRVKFLGIRTDIPEILAASDIVVLSSHWEGLSLSSIEGMASGRPFIASDVDGLKETVEGAGIVFPHGDYKALATTITNLCSKPQEYRNIAKRCQDRARMFDINMMAEKYYDLYKDLYNTLTI